MPTFSKTSLERLSTCHPDLQLLANTIIKNRDCTVLCGRRTKEDQDAAVAAGKSKTPWPKSKHNAIPPDLSQAMDIAPYPLPNWDDRHAWDMWGGYVLGVASVLGLSIRWGGDWGLDGTSANDKFFDAPHFEIKTTN